MYPDIGCTKAVDTTIMRLMAPSDKALRRVSYG